MGVTRQGPEEGRSWVFREQLSVWLERKERETCRELSLHTGKVPSLRAQRGGVKGVRRPSFFWRTLCSHLEPWPPEGQRTN